MNYHKVLTRVQYLLENNKQFVDKNGFDFNFHKNGFEDKENLFEPFTTTAFMQKKNTHSLLTLKKENLNNEFYLPWNKQAYDHLTLHQ